MEPFTLILGLLRGGLALAGHLAERAKNKQLITAGEHAALAKALSASTEEIKKVVESRTRFKRDPKYRDRVRKSFELDE